MTNEEKARYEELDAKDCLIDCEDIIDYYSLRCEILEERLEQLEKENQELKEEIEKESKLSTRATKAYLEKNAENEKLKNALDCLIDKLYINLWVDDMDCYITINKEDFLISWETYSLLKEVLDNAK